MNIALGKFTLDINDQYIDYPIDYLKDELTKILEDEIGIPMKYIQKNCDEEYIAFVVSSYLSKHPLRNPNESEAAATDAAATADISSPVAEEIIEELPEGLVTESVIEFVAGGINQNPEIAAVNDTPAVIELTEEVETVKEIIEETVETAVAEEEIKIEESIAEAAPAEETAEISTEIKEEVKEIEQPSAEAVIENTEAAAEPVQEEIKAEEPAAVEVKEEAPKAEEPVREEAKKQEAPVEKPAEARKENTSQNTEASEMMIAEPEILSKKPAEKPQEITLDQFKNLTVSILLMGEEKRRNLFGTSDSVEIFKRNTAAQIADKFGIFTCNCGTDICYIEANIPKGEKFEIKCPKCGMIHVRTKKAKSSTPSVISIVGA